MHCQERKKGTHHRRGSIIRCNFSRAYSAASLWRHSAFWPRGGQRQRLFTQSSSQELSRRERGPFPSDQFTVVDHHELTGLRIHLPSPDCVVPVSECQDLEILNQLDGFNALIVTNDVRDSHGLRVEESGSFAALRRTGASRYGRDVRKALVESREVGFSGASCIAAASVFTTESVTVALEAKQIRDQLSQTAVPSADFELLPDGNRAVFPVNQLSKYVFNQQTGVQPPMLTPLPAGITGICDNCGANLLSLLQFTPGAVGTLAFGKYTCCTTKSIQASTFRRSRPRAEDRSQADRIKSTSTCLYRPGETARGLAGRNFRTRLGHEQKRAAVCGGRSAGAARDRHYQHQHSRQWSRSTLGTLTLTRNNGTSATIPAGGRSIDQNGDNRIVEGEGREHPTAEFSAAATGSGKL